MEERIVEIMKEQLRDKDITIDSTFIDLGMDELDGIAVVLALEEELGLDISDEDAEKWNCVRDIVSYVTVKKEGEKK